MPTKAPSLPDARQTRPPGFNPNPQGGISIIPRRGWTPTGGQFGPLADRETLLAFAARNPWLLSEALADADPTMGKAQQNSLAACASPGTVKLYAYKDAANTGADSRDDAATAEIEDILKRLGPEVGGIDGLRVKGTMALLHEGFWGFEALLGPRGTGLASIGFVDANSIVMDRDETGALRVYQKQANVQPNGLRELNQATFFWHAHHASVKNPYGRAVFTAAVVETIAAGAFDQDLTDGVHNVAIARYVYKYSQETFWRIAVTPIDQGGLGLSTAAFREDGITVYNPAKEFVDSQVAAIGAYLADKLPDDNFIVDSSGGVEALPGADFTGLDPVLSYKDFRQIRSLDELATTIGRPSSGAQTYTTAEFGLKALGWEALRADVMGPILQAFDLHFAATGRTIVVRAEFEPIRRADVVQETNSDAVREQTYWRMYLRGAITFEDYCLKVSGTGVPRETPEQIAARKAAQGVGGTGEGATGGNDLPQDGTTQEERDANP